VDATRTPTWRVPLFEPDFGDEELHAVQKPVRDGWLTMGEMTIRLESEFAARCGAKNAIAVNNATAALHLAVLAAGIRPGDEVLCPTLTFVATANAVRYVGATPVFCNSIGPANLNVGPEQAAQAITPKTRGIMAVHYAGFPVDMIGLQALARKHDLVIIEDCAHALFSTLHGRCCGTWGTAAAFSFFSNKNMTCGEGGMVTTNDDAVAERIRIMRSHGMTTLTYDRYKGRAFSYDVVAHGYNYRIDEIRSALALVQLKRLDGFLADRRRVRERYRARLDGGPVLVPDFGWQAISRPGDSVGYHIMPVILPANCDRDAVAGRLKDQGIQSSMHYRPIHTFSAFAHDVRTNNPLTQTEELADRQLTLPLFPTMTDEQVDLVCNCLLDAVSVLG
jgi:dTDP-4-amino-4,6-dideoxygalactose transaminase